MTGSTKTGQAARAECEALMAQALRMTKGQLASASPERRLKLLMEVLPKLLAIAEKLDRLPKPPERNAAKLSEAEWALLARYLQRRNASDA